MKCRVRKEDNVVHRTPNNPKGRKITSLERNFNAPGYQQMVFMRNNLRKKG